jgi:hypothetical protein
MPVEVRSWRLASADTSCIDVNCSSARLLMMLVRL